MRKIAIIGSNTKAGYAISKILSKESKVEIYNFNHVDAILYEDIPWYGETILLDLVDKNNFRKKLLSVKPHYIINAFDMDSIELCEEHKLSARKYNVELVENLVKAAKIGECGLIQISSSEVYDKKKGYFAETDIPQPTNYYGKTKLEAENIIIPALTNYAILRADNIFGYPIIDDGWFDSYFFLLKNNKRVDVSENIIFSPTFSDDIGWAVLNIIDKRITGIFNVGMNNPVSQSVFFTKLCEIFSFQEKNINLKNKVRSENTSVSLLKSKNSLHVNFADLEDAFLSLRFQIENNN